MKKYILTCICSLFFALCSYSQEQIEAYSGGNVLYRNSLLNINNIQFQTGNANFNLINSDLQQILLSEIDSITFADFVTGTTVFITYNGNSVMIENPFDYIGSAGNTVTAVANNAAVTVNSTVSNIEVLYVVKGSTTNGSLTISSTKNFKILLENASIVSATLPAITVSSNVSAEIQFNGANTLSDAAGNTKKSVISSKGNLIFNGYGELNVTGIKRHGISSDKSIRIEKGTIYVTVSGAATLEAAGSGYDPSLSSAVKSDETVTINGGDIFLACTSTAGGGKGINADGNVIINGGTVNISTAGNGAVYTNENGVTDSYSASCISSDANISIFRGNIACQSSGAAGKGLNADGAITIGNVGASDAALSLILGTSGARFLVSGSTGGGPGGGGPGGGGNNADYANPKGIKSTGNLTVNSGVIRVNCTQTTEGGEGMESKGTFVVNGGDIEIHSYDDPINGGTSVTINGGKIFAAARGNDAIDSNGTLAINGGVVIANGVRGDGEGIDSERNYTLDGGILFATSGNIMCNPAGPQKAVRYSGAKAGQAICVKNSNNETILMYNVPIISGASSGQTVNLVFTHPQLVQGTYTLYYNGTITGGTNYNGSVAGGTFSGGSSKTFTISSAAYVTVN
ncbi:MAG: carbohydrate-binding domain-containing protein [Prevotellaceae bacterium]|nr:carbohydrate-binding domain-containing protein [Prevotellaceae bacterium]